MTEDDQTRLAAQGAFLLRCTERQKRGTHGEPRYGGPCSKHMERCIQCVIEQAVDELAALARLQNKNNKLRETLNANAAVAVIENERANANHTKKPFVRKECVCRHADSSHTNSGCRFCACAAFHHRELL